MIRILIGCNSWNFVDSKSENPRLKIAIVFGVAPAHAEIGLRREADKPGGAGVAHSVCATVIFLTLLPTLNYSRFWVQLGDIFLELAQDLVINSRPTASRTLFMNKKGK